MIFPLYDDNPRRGFPYASAGFLIVHVFVSLMTLAGLEVGAFAALGHGVADEGALEDWRTRSVGPFFTVFLALYLIWQASHLWVFADNVEDRVGTPLFVGAYLTIGGLGWLAGGGTGAALHGAFLQAVTAAMLGCYSQLFPKQQILCALPGTRYTPRIEAISLGWIWLSFVGVQLLAAWFLGMSVPATIVGASLGIGLGWITRVKTGESTSPPLSPPVSDWKKMSPGETKRPERRPATVATQERADSGPPSVPAATFLEPAQTLSSGGGGYETPDFWAAIRTGDDLRHLDRLARLVREYTHETLFDITRRLRNVRGLLAIDLLESYARELAEAARAIDVPSIALPWPVPPLQKRLKVGNVAWSSKSIALQTRGREERTFDIPWRRIRVAAGTRMVVRSGIRQGVDRSIEDWNRFGDGSNTTVSLPTVPTRRSARIDIIVEPSDGGHAPPIHLSIEEGQCLYSIEATSGGFEAVARALCDRSSLLATNPGLEKIADGNKPLARWGYLEFRSEAFRGQYLAWLSALAHPRHRGGGTTQAATVDSEIAFLE